MRWYRRAAQQANVHAELRLGDYYYFGLTGDPDYAKVPVTIFLFAVGSKSLSGCRTLQDGGRAEEPSSNV